MRGVTEEGDDDYITGWLLLVILLLIIGTIINFLLLFRWNLLNKFSFTIYFYFLYHFLIFCTAEFFKLIFDISICDK